jgi:hypothetical protein
MQRDPYAARRKLAPSFFIRDLVETQHISLEFGHLIDLGSEQNHAGHFHRGRLHCDIIRAIPPSLAPRGHS